MTREDLERWHNEISEGHVIQTVNEVCKIILNEKIEIVDVGSNTGLFTKLLSQRIPIKNAVLIEPSTELLDFSKNILPEHYHFVNTAIVDCSSTKEISMAFPYDQQNLNLGIARIDVRGDTIVPCQTLSSILDTIDFVPNYIKIDAEGYDTKILLSIADKIRDMGEKPVITFEVDKTSQLDDLKRIEIIFINELQYDMIDFRKDAWTTDIHLVPPE